MFKLERKYVALSPKGRQSRRQDKSRPVIDAFFDWRDRPVDSVLDDTPLAKAIGYARNQREALHTFLRDGRIPIHHNNRSERELRREPGGRKNWLFAGNDDAG